MKKFRLFSIMFLLAISCCLFSACGSNITLTINFDSNGGTSCKSIEYVVGKSFNMPDDPTKEDYVFGGWYTDNDKWNEPLTVNTILNYPLSKSVEITAYAKWIPVMYISFNTNGGEKLDKIVYDNANLEIPTPERNGYTFMGWYYDNGAWQQQFTIDSLNNIEPKSEITIYAKWALNRYINFESNGGSECESINLATITNYDMPTPTKPLFIFKGWFMDSKFETPFDKSLINFGEYDTAIIVYAKWEEKKVQNVTFYGSPKTEYVYGEEVDLNGMYAYVEYYYYEGEYIDITKDMVCDFNSTILVADKNVNQIKDTMKISLGEYFSDDFVYTISPKYKSIEIKKDSFQSEYLIGENSSYINLKCNGNRKIDGSYYKAIKFTIIATTFENTTEEIKINAYGMEKDHYTTECTCGKSHISPIPFYSYYISDSKKDQNGNKISRDKCKSSEFCIDLDNEMLGIKSDAYCDISTQQTGDFVGTLYYGLRSANFEYSVQYAESDFNSFEQSEYNFIQEFDNEDSLFNETITIMLENGRKFDFKIDDENYILSDFDFSTTGEKEAIIQYPYISLGRYELLKVKYSVFSLNDIEYIEMRENYLQSSSYDVYPEYELKTVYYHYGEELKSCSMPYSSKIPYFTLDLLNIGEKYTTIQICDIDIKIKYVVKTKITSVKLVNSKINLGEDVSLKTLDLYAYYDDTESVADLNGQRVGIYTFSDSILWKLPRIYIVSIKDVIIKTFGYKFTYEILEDLDTSSLGQKQAKIRLCDKEFLIDYEVVENG